MQKIIKNISSILCGALLSLNMYAGNPDRVGQAGAMQLNINPWARSSGWNNANVAGISGVEAMQLNVAGMGHGGVSEFVVSHSNWLGNTGIAINSFGFVQQIGDEKSNTIGVSIMSMGFGDQLVTTTSNPDGTLGYELRR